MMNIYFYRKSETCNHHNIYRIMIRFIRTLRRIWNQYNTREQAQNQESDIQENFIQQLDREIQERANTISERSNTIADDANNISQRANRISFWALILSIGVLAATVAVFWQTQKSVEAGILSAKVADSALQLQRNQRFTDSIADRHKDSTDSINTAKRFILDSTTFANQIERADKSFELNNEVFNASKKNFEIENRPIIVFSDFEFDTAFKKGNMPFKWVVFDAGKFPAFINHLIFTISAGTDTSYIIERTTSFVKDEIEFVSQNNTFPVRGNIYGWEYIKEGIRKGEIKIYLKGTMKYKNANTGKEYLKNFYYEFKNTSVGMAVTNLQDAQ